MKQKKFLAIVGSMLLALTACSGGGSELDPTPSPPLQQKYLSTSALRYKAVLQIWLSKRATRSACLSSTIKPTALPRHFKQQVTM